MDTNPRVLLVEADDGMRVSLDSIARDHNPSMQWESSRHCDDIHHALLQNRWDIIFIVVDPSPVSIATMRTQNRIEAYLQDQSVGNIMKLLQDIKEQPDAPDVVLLSEELPLLSLSRQFQAVGCREVFQQRDFIANMPETVQQIFEARCLRSYTQSKIRARGISVLFADIQGFTSWVRSNMQHYARVGYFLDTYLTAMTKAVHDHGGIVDKFIGDAVMGVFDAPDHRHARQAIECALTLRDRLSSMGVTVNIGINSGTVFEGLFGTAPFYQYTVVGDVVNVAARLQSRARHGQILVSPETYQSIQGLGFDISEVHSAPEAEPKAETYLCHVVQGHIPRDESPEERQSQ